MNLKSQFDTWARKTGQLYKERQWLLSMWETDDGIIWSQAKIDYLNQHLIDRLKLKKSDRLIELGCGGGWILQSLQSSVRDIIGLDFSEPMLHCAQKILKSAKFVCADVTQLSLKNGSLEKILCYFVLINFERQEQVYAAIAEIWRVLKKGGLALIGQIPHKDGSVEYDRDKESYLTYCRDQYDEGVEVQKEFKPSILLNDKKSLEKFLADSGINYTLLPSFNPFYRDGEQKEIDWRFDLILEK